MMTEAAKPAWAGFWRRVIAFIVDSLLLAGVGIGAGALLHEQLAALSGPTRLIGGAVGLLYFGLFSSGLGGSATLGMRLLGLRVASMRGRPLGLIVSLWRALWLQLPLTFNGLYLTLDDPLHMQVFGVFAVTVVFGLGLAQIVLLLFNWPSRRLAHDLLSGSAVVRKAAVGEPLPRHRAPAAYFAVLLVALTAAAGSWLAFAPPEALTKLAQPLLAPQKAVLALPEVTEAAITDNTHSFTSNGVTTRGRTLVVSARLNAWPKDEDAQAARIRDVVLKTYTLAPGQVLRVELRYGFDIGLSSFWRTWVQDYPAPAAPAAPPAAPQPADAPKPPVPAPTAPAATP